MPSPRLLARTDHYTEGVVVAPDGTLYFSMTSLGTITRFDPASCTGHVWAHVAAANGHAIGAANEHFVISSAGALLRLDESGRASAVVATRVDDRWLTYPNDVALDPQRGGCFFTDSGYKSMPGRNPVHPEGRVYRVEASGRVYEVAAGLAYSNGIALSREGTILYVGESVTRRIWSYPVRDDGSLGPRALLAQTPSAREGAAVPDGFTIGPDARLFVAHYGAREILVYEPNGTLVERLPSGNKTTSHSAFSPDGRTLYVSGGIEDESGPGAIFALDL